jgi:hypothetical protein
MASDLGSPKRSPVPTEAGSIVRRGPFRTLGSGPDTSAFCALP